MSEKQRLNREKFKRAGPKISMREKAALGKPQTSWWVGLDRDMLEMKALQENSRMRNSLLGRISPIKTIE